MPTHCAQTMAVRRSASGLIPSRCLVEEVLAVARETLNVQLPFAAMGSALPSAARQEDRCGKSDSDEDATSPCVRLVRHLVLVARELVAEVREKLEERDPGIVDVVIRPVAHGSVKR